MATGDDGVARVHLALYVRLMQRIRVGTSPKIRRVVETVLFVLVLHAVTLLVLLHLSFVRVAPSSSSSCLAPYVSPALVAASSTNELLVRVQVVASSTCPADASLSCPPLASFVFASQRAFLNQQHDIPLVAVPRSSACFDLRWIGQRSPLWDVLLDHALGYDTIVANHLQRWRGSGGVLLNEVSGHIYTVGVLPPHSTLFHKVWTLLLCIAQFVMSVTLIGVLGHEVIARALSFHDITQRRERFAGRWSFLRALSAQSMWSLALVPIALGLAFFYLERYRRDYVLAFGVLGVVGAGEIFSIICARSPLGRRYYPRLFCCWFVLFHIYFGAYPGGFSHVALLVLVMTLLHTILFFVNCVEMPDFLNHIRR